jgi:chemotaxis protein histidine kinase CheA
MPRGRPAKGSTKNGKAAEEPETKAAVEQQGNRSSMRLRAQSKVSDNKENVAAEQKKKAGRKRKAAGAPAEEKSEESTVADEAAPKDEAAPAKEEAAPTKEEAAAPAKEEESNPDPKEEDEDEEPAPTDASKPSQEGEIKVNRAPVLTMWVAAVAERQGFTFDEAVTFGKAISGLFAHSKGKRIGVIDDAPKDPDAETDKKKAKMEKFDVFGNSIYGKTTDKGRFALESGKAIAPNTVKAYLHRAFKDDYDRVREAFEALANSMEPEEIGSKAYNLYEKFRPQVPDGAKGWGARGLLDLKHVQELAASG